MTKPEIIEARWLAPDVKLFRITAPQIARKRRPGQFVILRVTERGERIPLTIADSDAEAGTVTIIAQGVGKTTKLLNTKETGDRLSDIVGPLGKPSEIDLFGTAVVIGGGLGAAIAYPTAKALKEAGNRVVSILGARTRELVILEEQMRELSDETHVMTDDGSHGERGLVTTKLQALYEAGHPVDFVLAVGPVVMMRAVAEVTRPFGTKTMVSLNPIMVDGTGMCGGCRVIVDGKSFFACVDGPEFDAHKVDFKTLLARNAQYRDTEQTALTAFLQEQEEHRRGGCELEKAHPEVAR